MVTHPVTYGYARVSKADDEARNLETQLRLLDTHGVRPHLIYRDVATGRSLDRSGWQDLMEVVRPGDTIVVAFLDRFSRNFEEGVRIQADLIERDIGIVAIRENIDTRDSTAAGKYFGGPCWPWGPTRWMPPARGPGTGRPGPGARDAASAGPPP